MGHPDLKLESVRGSRAVVDFRPLNHSHYRGRCLAVNIDLSPSPDTPSRMLSGKIPDSESRATVFSEKFPRFRPFGYCCQFNRADLNLNIRNSRLTVTHRICYLTTLA